MKKIYLKIFSLTILILLLQNNAFGQTIFTTCVSSPTPTEMPTDTPVVETLPTPTWTCTSSYNELSMLNCGIVNTPEPAWISKNGKRAMNIVIQIHCEGIDTTKYLFDQIPGNKCDNDLPIIGLLEVCQYWGVGLSCFYRPTLGFYGGVKLMRENGIVDDAIVNDVIQPSKVGEYYYEIAHDIRKLNNGCLLPLALRDAPNLELYLHHHDNPVFKRIDNLIGTPPAGVTPTPIPTGFFSQYYRWRREQLDATVKKNDGYYPYHGMDTMGTEFINHCIGLVGGGSPGAYRGYSPEMQRAMILGLIDTNSVGSNMLFLSSSFGQGIPNTNTPIPILGTPTPTPITPTPTPTWWNEYTDRMFTVRWIDATEGAIPAGVHPIDPPGTPPCKGDKLEGCVYIPALMFENSEKKLNWMLDNAMNYMMKTESDNPNRWYTFQPQIHPRDLNPKKYENSCCSMLLNKNEVGIIAFHKFLKYARETYPDRIIFTTNWSLYSRFNDYFADSVDCLPKYGPIPAITPTFTNTPTDNPTYTPTSTYACPPTPTCIITPTSTL